MPSHDRVDASAALELLQLLESDNRRFAPPVWDTGDWRCCRRDCGKPRRSRTWLCRRRRRQRPAAVAEPSNAQVAAITTSFFIFGRLLYDDDIRFRRPAADAEKRGTGGKSRSVAAEPVTCLDPVPCESGGFIYQFRLLSSMKNPEIPSLFHRATPPPSLSRGSIFLIASTRFEQFRPIPARKWPSPAAPTRANPALNLLTGQRQLARVSKTPGRTQ
jgi:hypothetical protein